MSGSPPESESQRWVEAGATATLGRVRYVAERACGAACYSGRAAGAEAGAGAEAEAEAVAAWRVRPLRQDLPLLRVRRQLFEAELARAATVNVSLWLDTNEVTARRHVFFFFIRPVHGMMSDHIRKFILNILHIFTIQYINLSACRRCCAWPWRARCGWRGRGCWPAALRRARRTRAARARAGRGWPAWARPPRAGCACATPAPTTRCSCTRSSRPPSRCPRPCCQYLGAFL